jgi:hypothetical protein
MVVGSALPGAARRRRASLNTSSRLASSAAGRERGDQLCGQGAGGVGDVEGDTDRGGDRDQRPGVDRADAVTGAGQDDQAGGDGEGVDQQGGAVA